MLLLLETGNRPQKPVCFGKNRRYHGRRVGKKKRLFFSQKKGALKDEKKKQVYAHYEKPY